MSDRAAGGCLLVGLGIGAVTALFAIAPNAGILLTVGGGWGLIVWSASRRNKIHIPSPPPPGPPLENTNTQVTEFVQDPTNPHRWIKKGTTP